MTFHETLEAFVIDVMLRLRYASIFLIQLFGDKIKYDFSYFADNDVSSLCSNICKTEFG